MQTATHELIAPSYLIGVRTRFLRRATHRGALCAIVLLTLLAAGADFVAADLPLALSMNGQLYLAPNLTRPAKLRAYDNQRLQRAMQADDWAIFPPIPWGYNGHDLSAVLAAPSGKHWLGTDSGGRDVLARVVHGARISLTVGVLSTLLLSFVGVLIGAVSAYAGGLTDLLLMRVVEVVHALPTVLLLVTVLAITMPSGWGAALTIAFVIGLSRWTAVVRLVRAEILRVRGSAYVDAARALGLGPASIVVRHVLPNALTPVLVTASFSMASAILIEGALSFLGFGIPPDMASWGGMLNDVREHTDAWWLAVFPGAAIFVTVTIYNLAGEGLRDAIDPRLRM